MSNEGGIIDLGHGPSVPVQLRVRLWPTVYRFQGQPLVQVEVAIQYPYVVPVNRVMAAPGMLSRAVPS